MASRKKTTWEGYSFSKVVWYSHPQDPYVNIAAKRLAFDTTLPFEGRDGTRLPPPRRTLTGFAQQQNGVELTTGGESDIESISWHKDTGEPCGVLSITLKPRKDWGNHIQPDDCLFVYLKGDKTGQLVLLSVVSVDTISKTRVVDAAGATVGAAQIHCRDIGGKALMDTPTIYDSNAGSVYATEFFNELADAFSSEVNLFGGPSLLVQNIVNTFYSTKQLFTTKGIGFDIPEELQPFRFPGYQNNSLMSLVDTNTYIQAPMVGAVTQNPNILMSANNLWSLCDLYANRIVNEMFIDVRDVNHYGIHSDGHASTFAAAILAANGEGDSKQRQTIQALAAVESGVSLDALRNTTADTAVSKFDQRALSRLSRKENSVMAMVHRQLPYDTVSFYLLPTNVVHETEIYELNVSRSAREVFNTFRVRLAGGSGQAPYVDELVQDQFYGLTVNRDSIMRHGIRRYDGESIYALASGVRKKDKADVREGENLFDAMYHYYMGLVTTWYAYNELLWSGTITMRLRPDIRVGTRLSLYTTENAHEEIWDYYIQSVEHTFTPEPGGSRTTLQVIRGVNRASDGPETKLIWTDRGREFGLADPFEAIVPVSPGFPNKSFDTGAAR